MSKAIDHTGKKYHKLTAIKFTDSKRKPWGRLIRYWLFECECGNIKELECAKVAFGDIKNCGCENAKLLTGREHGQEHMAKQIWYSYNDGDLTFEDFQYLAKQPCYLCGNWNPSSRKHKTYPDISYQYHGLDRIDNSRPHDRDNVQPCCWPCNERRSNMPLPEFLEWIESIYNNRIKMA